MVFTEKQQKLININILQVKKYYLLIENKYQNKLSLHILLQEKLQKNKQKKQVGALRSVDLSNRKDELKQTEGIFPKTCRMI